MVSMQSQVYGPVNHIKEEEGEGEQGSGIQVDSFGSGGDNGFRRWRFPVVLGLGFAETSASINGLPVAVKVRQLKVPRE